MEQNRNVNVLSIYNIVNIQNYSYVYVNDYIKLKDWVYYLVFDVLQLNLNCFPNEYYKYFFS